MCCVFNADALILGVPNDKECHAPSAKQPTATTGDSLHIKKVFRCGPRYGPIAIKKAEHDLRTCGVQPLYFAIEIQVVLGAPNGSFAKIAVVRSITEPE